MVTIAQFVEEVEPIGKVKIKAKDDKAARNYDVFRPDDLEEKYYMRYFEARARSVDVVRKYTKYEEVEGTVVTVPNDNPSDILRMEAELHLPARDMVAALLGIEPKDIGLRPKTLIRVYNTVEKMLVDAAVPNVDDVEVPGLDTGGDSSEDGGEEGKKA